MCMPNIPDFKLDTSVSREEAILMLLSSIAKEEMALSGIIHGQAEAVQHFFQVPVDEQAERHSCQGNCVEDEVV